MSRQFHTFPAQVARSADAGAEAKREMDQKMTDSRQRLISEGAREEVLDEWEELAFQVTSAVLIAKLENY